MGGVYRRYNKLWFRVKGPDGKWTNIRSGLRVGEEEQAQHALRKLERHIKAGGELPPKRVRGPVLTVATYAQRWLADRKARRLATAVDDEARLATHIIPLIGALPLDDVRPRHIRDFVRALRVREGRRGMLAPRTIRHLYFQIKSVFHDALVDELVSANPCILKKGELPKRVDKDPAWRVTAIFSRTEVERILADPSTPSDRRMLYSLLFLGGMRFGEAAALRWQHYDPQVEPLGKLFVARSFSTRRREEGAVKTEMPREVPVHPLLAERLDTWRSEGWSSLMGRPPTLDDLILPSRIGGERNRAVNHGLERFHEDLRRIGLRPRRLHDARRTFITLARQGEANKELLRWVTHGAATDILDVYTTPAWEARCSAVMAVELELAHDDKVPTYEVRGDAAAAEPRSDIRRAPKRLRRADLQPELRRVRASCRSVARHVTEAMNALANGDQRLTRAALAEALRTAAWVEKPR